MTCTPKIVFISHDASRTGAPIVFLNFLRWFKQNTDIPFQILLRKGGELEVEFAKLASTLVFETPSPKTLSQRILRRLGLYKPNSAMIRQLTDANIGLIYSNTATNGQVLQALEFLGCPVISHIHELEYIIQYFGIDEFEKTKIRTTHFIACANTVKSNLIEHHNICPENISVIYEFIPIPAIQENHLNQKLLEYELSLPDQAFIVGASATTDWRKGTDLFIQLAYIVKRKAKDAPIRFVWVGNRCKGIEYFALQQEILKAGLVDYVHFIGSKPNPLDYFARFDIFTLTSREDPYPLVCLEAASLGKPIICFAQAGGEPEFVEDDCGFVVPYLDLDIMADRVIELYQSPNLRQRLGQNAKNKVSDRHDINTTAPRILEVIKEYLN